MCISADVGLKWSELSKTLNPNYNWEAAIQTAMDSDEPLEEVWNLLEFAFVTCNVKEGLAEKVKEGKSLFLQGGPFSSKAGIRMGTLNVKCIQYTLKIELIKL